MDLARSLREALPGPGEKVFAIYEASKLKGGKRGLEPDGGSLRVLALAARRAGGPSNFKGTLHVAKKVGSRLVLSKSIPLAQLAHVRALAAARDGADGVALSAGRGGSVFGASQLPPYGLRGGPRAVADFVRNVASFCAEHERGAPAVEGLDAQLQALIAEAPAEEGDAPAGVAGSGRPRPQGATASRPEPPPPARPALAGPPPPGRPADPLPPGRLSPTVGGPRHASPSPDPPAARAAEGGGFSPSLGSRPSELASPVSSPPGTRPTSPVGPLSRPRPGRSREGSSDLDEDPGELEAVLELVAGAGGSAAEVRTQLASELAALEASVVHELLESAQSGRALAACKGAREALGALADAEATLDVADAKLRALREDAVRVEARARALEAAASSAAGLEAAVAGVLARLELPPGVEATLRAPNFSARGIPAFAAAASAARRAIRSLEAGVVAEDSGWLGSASASPPAVPAGVPGAPEALPAHVASMAAVAGRRAELEELLRGGVDRAAAWLTTELARGAGASPSPGLAGSARDAAAARERLHASSRALRPLVVAVLLTRPDMGPRLVGSYATQASALLRRDLSQWVADAIRRAGPDVEPVGGGGGGGGGEDGARAAAAASGPPAGAVPPGDDLAQAPRPSPLAEALGRVLDAFLPLAQAESQLAADAFAAEPSRDDQGHLGFDASTATPPTRTSISLMPAAEAAASAVLAGVDADLCPLADRILTRQGLSALPMLATTSAWDARLEREGGPGHAALRAALGRLDARLRGVLAKGRATWETGVTRQWQRQAGALAGGSVKAVHIFATFARGLALVAQTEASLGRELTRLEAQEGRGADARAGTARDGRQRRAVSPEAGAPSRASALRALASVTYVAILDATLGGVEACAARDAKHGQRLRLENYSSFHSCLSGRAGARLPAPAREAIMEVAEAINARLAKAEAAYIEEQVRYFGFAKVLELSRRLDALAEGTGRAALPMGQAEVRALMATTAQGLDKRLAVVHRRLVKHLQATSPELVPRVWTRIEGICIDRWRRMGRQIPALYDGLQLRPTVEELQRWLAAAEAAT